MYADNKDKVIANIIEAKLRALPKEREAERLVKALLSKKPRLKKTLEGIASDMAYEDLTKDASPHTSSSYLGIELENYGVKIRKQAYLESWGLSEKSSVEIETSPIYKALSSVSKEQKDESRSE